MCGIAGLIGRPDEATAREMIGKLVHRGPDGVRVERVGDSVLAHARLSIIDLEGGWQPLHAAGSTVIGNGEIYNYLELIEEFGLKDRLSTGSDFEPLLHLYALEGEKAFARLRGMYAFCLIGCDGRTWLVRDPFGIKPLYVRQDEGGVAFASEPQALRQDMRFVEGGATDLFALNYVLNGGTHGGDAWRLPRGAVVLIRDGQMVEGGSRQPAVPNIPPSPADEAEALGKLDTVLQDSVTVHQRSDVPYGLFLSGGIDSSIIATLMARLNTRPVTAFTCGFDAPGAADERAKAEKVARALNLDWRETTFGEEDFWRIAPLVAQALDDPTTDYACLPTYKLAEAAKGTLTVVLSGEGGDELFAGYGRYRRALRPRWLGGRPSEPQIDAPFLKTEQRSRSLPGETIPLFNWRQEVRGAGWPEPPNLTPLQKAQWADIATWLPNDLLLKLDRCLMAHGLEGRTPFLDREVAGFAFSLPDRMKVRGRYGKWLLRRWLEQHCPAAEPWARKQGFTVPVASWIAPRAQDLGPRIAAVEGVAEVCDVEAVKAVFADPKGGKHWWPLLFYALWQRIQVEKATPAEALASLLGG